MISFRACACRPLAGGSTGGVNYMPRKHEIFPSSYYNSQEVRAGPILLTIDFAKMEPVGNGNGTKEKLVVHFKEKNSKLLVVSPTKFDAIALIAKSDETEDWPGVTIVLEAGKASLQGKLVDCVNVRPPRKPKRMGGQEPTPSKSPEPPIAEAETDFDDAIEF
jgi:hypothetical protein